MEMTLGLSDVIPFGRAALEGGTASRKPAISRGPFNKLMSHTPIGLGAELTVIEVVAVAEMRLVLLVLTTPDELGGRGSGCGVRRRTGSCSFFCITD